MSQSENCCWRTMSGKSDSGTHHRQQALDSKMPLAIFEKELSKSNWPNGNLPGCEYFRSVWNAGSPGGFVEAQGASADAKQVAASRPMHWHLSIWPENQRGVASTLNSTTVTIGSPGWGGHAVLCLSNDSSSLIFLLQSLMGADRASSSVTASSCDDQTQHPDGPTEWQTEADKFISKDVGAVPLEHHWPVQACRLSQLQDC